MGHEVVISYSFSDKNDANAVCAGLEEGGIRCWIAPRDVLPGRPWSGEIARAIKQAKILVLLLTGEANHSKRVLAEIDVALNNGLTVVPVKLDESELSDELQIYLSATHWLDAITPPLAERIQELREKLQSYLREAPPCVTETRRTTRPAKGTVPATVVQPPAANTSGAQRRWEGMNPPPDRPHYRVYLAATPHDLMAPSQHLAFLITELHKHGCTVVPWDECPLDTDELPYRAGDVATCDLFVLVMAFSRGPREDGGNSATQAAMCEALEKGLDVRVFLMCDDAAWPRNLDDSRSDAVVEEWRAQLRLDFPAAVFDAEPTSIPIADVFSEWARAKQESDRQRAAKRDGVTSEHVRRLLIRACQIQVSTAHRRLAKQGKYHQDTYVRRRLDYVIERFYADPKRSCVLIVDDPGTGKSSLLANQAAQLTTRGVPCVLLASDEYLEDGGHDCPSFEHFVLRAIRRHWPNDGVPDDYFNSLDALVDQLPESPDSPRLVVVLDGVNEIHSAGEATEGYESDPVIGSQALLDFIERTDPRAVKLIVSSRRLTWAKHYEDDSHQWREASWEPDWLALCDGDFLDSVRLGELLPEAATLAGAELKGPVREKVSCLALGPFTELEASLAIGCNQRINCVRIVPGTKAFEQLTDPFFLGLCFTSWAQRQREQGSGWYYVSPEGQSHSPSDLRISTVPEFDTYEMMAGFWRASEDRVCAQVAESRSCGQAPVRAALSDIVTQLVAAIWANGTDRVKRVDLADDELKKAVVRAMCGHEMLVEDQDRTGDAIVRFPRDRVAGFHIVRTIRERLRYGDHDVLRKYLTMARQHELFGGLLPLVVDGCLDHGADVAKRLLRMALWCRDRQPEWFIEVCHNLMRLPEEQRSAMVDDCLLRFLTFLSTEPAWGDIAGDDIGRADRCYQQLHAWSASLGSKALVPRRVGLIPADVRLCKSPMARRIIHQLPRILASARDVANGIEQILEQLARRLAATAPKSDPPLIGPKKPASAEQTPTPQTDPESAYDEESEDAAPPSLEDTQAIEGEAASEKIPPPSHEETFGQMEGEGTNSTDTHCAATDSGEGDAPNDDQEDSFDFDDFGELSLEHEYHNLANDYYKISEFDKAIEHYNKALELKPDLLETYFNRALAYTRKSMYDRALEDMSKVIALNPQLAEAYYTRGLIYEYKQEYDLAILDYDVALEIDPDYAKAEEQRRVVESKKSVLERGGFVPPLGSACGVPLAALFDLQESLSSAYRRTSTTQSVEPSVSDQAFEHSDLSCYFGRCGRSSQGDTAARQALEYCEEALAEQGNPPLLLLLKAALVLRLREASSLHVGEIESAERSKDDYSAQALTCLDEGLSQEGLAEAHCLAGMAFLSRQDYDAAQQRLLQSLTIAPCYCNRRTLLQVVQACTREIAEKHGGISHLCDETRLLYQRSLRLSRLGKYRLACDCLKSAVRNGLVLTPALLTEVANAVWFSGRTQTAVDAFLTMIWSGLLSSKEETYHLLGRVGAAFTDTGNIDSAIDYTLAANALDCGRNAWSHHNLSCDLLERPSVHYDAEAALREAVTACELDPEYAGAWFCRAEAEHVLDLREAAEESCRTGMQLSEPSAVLCRFILAVRLTSQIEPDEVRALLEQAREQFDAYDEEARSLYVIGSYVHWLYCAARTRALLRDDRYVTYADRACQTALAARESGLRPYIWDEERTATVDEFVDACAKLDQVFLQAPSV